MAMSGILLLRIITIGGSIFCILVIGYEWFYRIRRFVDSYLDELSRAVGTRPLRKRRLLPLYSKYEVAGVLKGRQVIGGVKYSGVGIEWMPFPYIKIKLKEVIRYNVNRLPEFAFIDKGWLVFKIKHRLVWGIFDREYSRFFTKDYILIALTRLIAVADDLERGKTMNEVFK